MTENNVVVNNFLSLKHNHSKASNVYIEISGRCNAKCPYCARQRFKQRYSGKNMSPVLFENIINHLLTTGLIDQSHASAIFLYNWGEPFLNPEINSILKILKRKNLLAVVSSNFIVSPEVDIDNFMVIREVIFSVSGFTQESYGKIHGASLKKVLNNFDHFYDKIRSYSPKTLIFINWHRYTFNEKEFWDAYKYFDRPGIVFRPVIAQLNDLPEMINYIERKIPEQRLNEAGSDLFLDHISKKLDYYKKISKPRYCFMWDSIVIDETGQLMLCCGMTNNDYDHILGNVTELPAEKIWQKKMSDSVCNKCISYGLPLAFATMDNKSLPKGGGKDYLKLSFKLNLLNMFSNIVRMIKRMPIGKKIIGNKKVANKMIIIVKKLFT